MKTLRKTLSVLVVLAMLLAFVPTVYAAEADEQKTTYDISSKNLVITNNKVYYGSDEYPVDPDGYIITGKGNWVDNYLTVENTTDSDCTFDLVFQDLELIADSWASAMQFKTTDGTCLTVNIEIIGTNKINADDHPALKTPDDEYEDGYGLGTYVFNLTVSGTASFEMKNRRDSYNAARGNAFYNDGTVSAYVNGQSIAYNQTLVHGTHTGETQTGESYTCSECGLLCCKQHTGGTQTCKGYKCTVCGTWYGEKGEHTGTTQTCKGYKCPTCGEWYGEKGAHVDENSDGMCDACDKVLDAIECDTTLTVASEHFYVFTPETSGQYRLYSTSSSDSDPYVYMFTESYSYSADDNGKGYNFILDFYALAGMDYYFYLQDYQGFGVAYTVTLEKGYEISHQPTVTEPYVKLNWNDEASYQWLECDEDMLPIDLDKASVYTVYNSGGSRSSSYTTENGWTGVRMPYATSPGLCFFEISVDSATTISVISDTDLSYIELYSNDDGTVVLTENIKAGQEYLLTIEKAGKYYLDAEEYNNANVNIQASYVDGEKFTELEDETTSVLQNPTLNKIYYCAVTLENGAVLQSDVFRCVYSITHQPTAAEPFVKLNVDVDDSASYQWYEIETKKTTVDTSNAQVFTNGGDSSSYSAETGWTGVGSGSWLSFFDMSFTYGTKISFISNKDLEYCELYDYNNYETIAYLENIKAGKEYVFEVNESGNFTFDVYDSQNNDICIKAEILKDEYKKLEGETASELQNMTLGKSYFCEVMPTDNIVIDSQSFKCEYAITHQPTAEEAYVKTNDENAEYQWYSVKKETTPVVEVTDKIACPDWTNLNKANEKASYIEDKGWKGTQNCYYFVMYLNQGDTIKLSYSDGDSHWLDCEYSLGDIVFELSANDDNEYVFTAPANAYYGFVGSAWNGLYLNAQYTGYTYTEIEGATNADFTPDTDGLYACDALFSDDTSEMSNIVSLKCVEDEPTTDDNTGSSDGKCEHICHHTNPVSKFFWKIICYFFKLLNISHYCTCGAAHY